MTFMQTANHCQREPPFAVQHLRYPLFAAQVGNHIGPAQPAAFHVIFQHFHRIVRFGNGVVFLFPPFNQRDQNLQPVAFRCAGLGVQQLVHFLKRSFIISFCMDRLDVREWSFR